MLMRRALILLALSPLATQGVIAQPSTIPSTISDEKRTSSGRSNGHSKSGGCVQKWVTK
jgi:hypothetical protein